MVALLGGGELAVGLALVAWPDPTRRVVAVVAGAWLLVYGIVATTIAVFTRAEEPRWAVPMVAAIINTAFGVTLLVGRGGTIRATAIVLGLLAVVEGAFEIGVALLRGTRRGPRPPGRGKDAIQREISRRTTHRPRREEEVTSDRSGGAASRPRCGGRVGER